jgi:catechol 2,3-dioxygenase-like lactoylglutathione lyase family enzyme
MEYVLFHIAYSVSQVAQSGAAPMTLTAIHHVQITVPPADEAAAREFYLGVLGLPEIPKPDSLKGRGGFWMQFGPTQIHVGVEDGFDRRTTKAHVAYQVSDVKHWRGKLEAVGCKVLESIPIPGYERFETRDPFGNRVEFIQPLA